MLFLAMQVRVMAACMESQIDKQEYTASAQSRARDGTGGINQPSDVCVKDLYNTFLSSVVPPCSDCASESSHTRHTSLNYMTAVRSQNKKLYNPD